MAIVKSGPYKGFSGTVDGLTYSIQPNGTTVVKRKNGKSRKAPTIGQEATKADTDIYSQFMKPFKEFALVGYDLEARAKGINHHNAMVQSNRKNSLQGIYPNRSIDYSKVLITKSSLPAAETAVTMTASGISFTWSTEIIPYRTHYSDQVIMLAYFPELNETRYITAGSQRHVGKDLLILDGIKKGYEAEVYISFVTDDRRNISNSIHLGQLIW